MANEQIQRQSDRLFGEAEQAPELALGATSSASATDGMSPERSHESQAHSNFFAIVRYQIKGLLTKNRKKKVHLAHDTHLERDVALVLMKTDLLDEGSLNRLWS